MISMISIDFHGCLAWVFENGMQQPAAAIETFARFQLPAIDIIDFKGFSLICNDFDDFHGSSWIYGMGV